MNASALRHLAAVAMLLALAACRPEGGSAPPVADEKAHLRSFLEATYGPQARGITWPVDGRTDLQRRVCAQGRSVVASEERVLLAVCTEGVDAGHGESGLVDFFVLVPDAAAWRIAAQLREVETGSWGSAGTVTISRIGRDRPAFLLEDGWAGQGYLFETRSLYAVVGGTLRDVAMLRGSLSNEGACPDEDGCPDTAFGVEFDLSIDAGDPAAEAYDLLVHEHGSACGETLNLRHRITFDAAAGRYDVPGSLLREDCAGDAGEVPGQARTPQQ
jgi:hypothetical protein